MKTGNGVNLVSQSSYIVCSLRKLANRPQILFSRVTSLDSNKTVRKVYGENQDTLDVELVNVDVKNVYSFTVLKVLILKKQKTKIRPTVPTRQEVVEDNQTIRFFWPKRAVYCL